MHGYPTISRYGNMDSVVQTTTLSMESFTTTSSSNCRSSVDRQLMQLHINTANSLVQLASRSSNRPHSVQLLKEACEVLEQGRREQQQQQQRQPNDPSKSCPMLTLLIQIRHRLGYISLTSGNLVVAAKTLLQVIKNMNQIHSQSINDDATAVVLPLSYHAYAMTLYDVGVIYMMYGRMEEAQNYLTQAHVQMNKQLQQRNRHQSTGDEGERGEELRSDVHDYIMQQMENETMLQHIAHASHYCRSQRLFSSSSTSASRTRSSPSAATTIQNQLPLSFQFSYSTTSHTVGATALTDSAISFGATTSHNFVATRSSIDGNDELGQLLRPAIMMAAAAA